MWTDGRIRDWCGNFIFKGDEFTVYYCWTPVDDPNSLDIEPKQIPSKTDMPFYEIYLRGHNKVLHKTFNKPSDEDFSAAQYKAANQPSYLLIGIFAFHAAVLFWLFFLH